MNRLKYTFREKLLKSIHEGTSDLNVQLNRLEKEVRKMGKDISEVQGHTELRYIDIISELSRMSRNYDFVSGEYILDAIEASKGKKKRVLICGFYGGRNLGDELMLRSILKRLDSKNLDITILLAPHQEVDASVYAPFSVIHYPMRNDDILLLAKNYDYIVWGGGAVLDDNYYRFEFLNANLGYILLKLSLAAIKSDKKIFVLGVSTNQKLVNREFLRDLQVVIDGASFFSLRDKNSLKTLETAGIDTTRIETIHDLAISDIPLSVQYTEDASVLCLGMVFLFDDESFAKIEAFVHVVVDYLSSKRIDLSKVIIKFIPFYDQGGSDRRCFSRIIDSFNSGLMPEFIIEEFPDSMDSLLNIMGQCSCVFSMRYHAVLISKICGIPVVSIDYSNEHRHYSNKLAYIGQKYGGLEKIAFSDIDNKEEVFEMLNRELRARKRGVVDARSIKLCNDQLSKILKSIR